MEEDKESDYRCSIVEIPRQKNDTNCQPASAENATMAHSAGSSSAKVAYRNGNVGISKVGSSGLIQTLPQMGAKQSLMERRKSQDQYFLNPANHS